MPRVRGPDDAPHELHSFREFGQMDRAGIRTSLEPNDFAYLQNVMRVAPGNLQTVRTALQISQRLGATTAVWATNGWYAELASQDLTLGTVTGLFTTGETVTGSVSGASGTILYNLSGELIVTNLTGTFLVGDTVTGGSSAAHAPVTATAPEAEDWMLVAYSDGSLWAQDLDGQNVIQIGAPGTFILDATTWSNSVVLLVGQSGYYAWGGSGNLVKITSADAWTLGVTPVQRLTLTGITGTFTVGETIKGGTSLSTGVLVTYDVVHGYLYVRAVVGTFVTTEVATGQTSTAHGTISALSVAISTPFTVGEAVTDAQTGATAKVTSYNVTTGALVLNTVVGTFNAGDDLSGAASGLFASINTVDTSAPPAAGTTIAVFSGRVWVTNNRTTLFSGPNDYLAASWDQALGAGSFLNTDPSLKGPYTKQIVANGYLYQFGKTSIDIISQVYVPPGSIPPTPVFTRTNINAEVGTPYPQSVILYTDRLVLFQNQFGIWALQGVQVERVSKKIDTILQQLDPNPPGAVSAGVAVVNSILTACFLVSWFDPVVSTTRSRQTILCFNENGWFLYDPFNVNPAGTFALLIQGVTNSLPVTLSLFNSGTIGAFASTAYELFESADVPIVRTVQTALWDMGQSIVTKEALVFGVEGQVTNLQYNLTAQVDSEGASSAPVSFLPTQFVWFGGPSATQPFTWYTTNVVNTFAWVQGGYSLSWSDVTAYGKYIGISITGITGDAVISAFNLEYLRRRGATWAL